MGSECRAEFKTGRAVVFGEKKRMKIRGKQHCTAVVLSAGQGKRMGTSMQKQYIELQRKPVITHTLSAFQDSDIIDDVILVVGAGQEKYVREEIVQRNHFTKVREMVPGGEERYASVWCGLKAFRDGGYCDGYPENYIFIHDGARPFVSEEILERAYETVCVHRACVAGMPSKDTVKLVDDGLLAVSTPQRKYVWAVQTPQVFEASLIIEAYSRLMREEYINVTDDAMVVEQMMDIPVKLFEGSYENIKITTPEDLDIARLFLSRRADQKT